MNHSPRVEGTSEPICHTEETSLFCGFLDQSSSVNSLLCEMAKSMTGWLADPDSASRHTGEICFVFSMTALQILKQAVMFP